jgi:translation initiation factor IF-3
MAHQELGRDLLSRISTDTVDEGKVESMPKMEGRQMIMVIGPKAT